MKNNNTLTSTMLKFGAILLFLRVMVQFLFVSQLGPEALYSNNAMPLIELGLTTILMIYGGYHFRDNNGLQISLQEGFTLMIGIYAVASLGSILWQLIWVNYLDPTIMMAAPDPAIFAAANIFNNFFSSLILGSVFALAFSYILSKRKARIS